MQRSRGLYRLLVALTALVAVSGQVLVSTSAQAADPSGVGPISIHLNKRIGLQPGQRIVAFTHDAPADEELAVQVCDGVSNDVYDGCPTVGTTRSDAHGNARATVTVPGVVTHTFDIGDYPVYCRADNCRVFFSRQLSDTERDPSGSPTLELVGSPASVGASPSTGLGATQVVTVSGTAPGAEGRTVRLTEDFCYSRLAEVGCFASRNPRTVVVDPSGGFSTPYRVNRRIGTADCGTANESGSFNFCQVTAVVLNPDGSVDTSFGDPSYADAGAVLSFRS